MRAEKVEVKGINIDRVARVPADTIIGWCCWCWCCFG